MHGMMPLPCCLWSLCAAWKGPNSALTSVFVAWPFFCSFLFVQSLQSYFIKLTLKQNMKAKTLISEAK